MKSQRITGGGGIQLYVEETGNPQGKPILFIYGFSQSTLSWSKQMNSDLADDFRLVALDIRGHGLSDKPVDAYGDSQLWADDINAVITTLGLDKPVLVGWSYGVQIMCDYLRFYGDEQISGLNFVAGASKLGEGLYPFVTQDFLSLVPGFLTEAVEESVANLENFIRMQFHNEPSREDVYMMMGFNSLVPPSVRAGLLNRSVDNDDVLAKLTKPVLLTQSEEDALVVMDTMKYHEEKIQNTQTSIIPRVGHMSFWEDAERFNSDLRSFINSL